MISPLAPPRIAVLGLSLDLYHRVLPDYMPRWEEQLRAFAAAIGPRAEVADLRLCHDRAHVAEAVAAAEAQCLDALLLVPLSYTASGLSVPVLLTTRLPLVVWNTQELAAVGKDYTFDTLLMNHVTQGTQDVTHVLWRSGRGFGMESGHYADAAALHKLGDWLLAARAAAHALRMKVGIIGRPFPGMLDFEVDFDQMRQRWGPQVVQVPVAELVRRAREAGADDVRRLSGADAEQFELAPEITPDMHADSARLEAALGSIVAEAGLAALTMNFMDLIEDGRSVTLPFLGINKGMAAGLGYAGEGDVLTAALMAQMRALCGVATFTEMFTVDYAANRVLMMHMQECNPAMARRDRRVRLVRKDFWAPGIRPYVGMYFTLEPGPATLVCLVPDGRGSFRYAVAEGRIPDVDPLPGLDVPHWFFQLETPVGEFLTEYSMAGGPHHLVAVPGHRAAAVARLAQLQGFACTIL